MRRTLAGALVFLGVCSLALLAWTAWRLARGVLDLYLLAHAFLFTAWTVVAIHAAWQDRQPMWCTGCGRRRLDADFCPGCGALTLPRALA